MDALRHWTGRPVGLFLGKVFEAQRPLLAVDAAGALPYYYRLPCLDMLGWTDRYIATHPPPGIGAGYVGHELGVTVDAENPARLTRLKLAEGTWVAEILATGPAELHLTSAKTALHLLRDTRFSPGTAGLRKLIDLEIRVPAGSTAHVQELVFQRVDAELSSHAEISH